MPDSGRVVRQPAPLVIPQRHGDGRQPEYGHDHRPLDQHTRCERGPTRHHQSAARFGARAIAGGQIEPKQHTLGAQHAGQQHRIGLGDMGFGRQPQGQRQQRRPDQRRRRRRHGRQAPEGEKGRDDGADQRRQPVGPDRIEGRGPERPGRGGLQPVDADRLLVAGLGAEADVDGIAGFHHLLGGLREARLVAVQNRQAGKSRQPRQQAQQHQRGIRPPRQGRQMKWRGLAGRHRGGGGRFAHLARSLIWNAS